MSHYSFSFLLAMAAPAPSPHQREQLNHLDQEYLLLNDKIEFLHSVLAKLRHEEQCLRTVLNEEDGQGPPKKTKRRPLDSGDNRGDYETNLDGFHEQDSTDMEPTSQEAPQDDETNGIQHEVEVNDGTLGIEDDESALQRLRQALLGANDDDDDDTSSDDSSSDSAD
jgi:hypothetical protein